MASLFVHTTGLVNLLIACLNYTLKLRMICLMSLMTYRPVICEIIGLNFAKCNYIDTASCFEDQLIIDRGIPHLNRAIASMNMGIDVISPWQGTTVHSNTSDYKVGPQVILARRRSRPAGEVDPRIILKWEVI